MLEVLPVDTNIVIFRPDSSWKTVPQVLEELGQKGVKGLAFGPEYIRFITHLDVTEEMVDQTVSYISEL